MRRPMMRLALLSLVLLLGCPPPPPRQHVHVKPADPEEVPHPKPSTNEPLRPADDDKPVAPITSADLTAMIASAQGGVITALPGIKVFLREKRLEIEGVTALKVGPQLELLACSRRGKAYESLLVWLVEPEHLHLALLFLGLTPKPQVTQFGQPGALAAKGDRVVIEIEWKEKDGKVVRRRVEDLLFDCYRDGCMKYAGWLFTGSHMADIPQPPDWNTTKKVYAANVSGTLAATYHDPDALLDTPLAEGGNNTTFVAWAERLPDRHTPIVTHIRPWRDGDEKEPPDALRAKNAERPPGGGPPGGGDPPPPEPLEGDKPEKKDPEKK